jgi:hypothetical protein
MAPPLLMKQGEAMAHEDYSTIVQSFSADLDSMFGLGPNDTGVGQLEQTVEEK